MNKVIILISSFILLGLAVSAQHCIRANHAINHIGQQAVIADSIYNVKVYNDSTALIGLGGKGSKAQLNILLNFHSKSGLTTILSKSLNESLLEATGSVILVDDQPTIVITDTNKLYFYSKNINQRWLALSQL
jgi:hypothetical protein